MMNGNGHHADDNLQFNGESNGTNGTIHEENGESGSRKTSSEVEIVK